MPDVSPNADQVAIKTYVAFDVHKRSIVAAALRAKGGEVELREIPNEERSIRRLIDRLGGPGGLSVCWRGRALRLCPLPAAEQARRQQRRRRPLADPDPGR